MNQVMSSPVLQVSSASLSFLSAGEQQLSPLLAGCDTDRACLQFPRAQRKVAARALPAGSLQSREGGSQTAQSGRHALT